MPRTFTHTNGAPLDEVVDVEVPFKLWAGPGHPPLLLSEPGQQAWAREPIEAIVRAPRSCRPGARDRWLDLRSGYGGFSMLAKRCGVELIVPIEPEPELADLAGRAMFLEGMPAPGATDPDTDTVAAMIETLELNAVRLDAAPWLPLAELPNVGKVIERAGSGAVPGRKESLERLYANVLVNRAPQGWGDCYLFAWGRYGSRT